MVVATNTVPPAGVECVRCLLNGHHMKAIEYVQVDDPLPGEYEIQALCMFCRDMDPCPKCTVLREEAARNPPKKAPGEPRKQPYQRSKCACTPNCEKWAMEDRKYAYGHAPRNQRDASIDLREKPRIGLLLPSAADLDAIALEDQAKEATTVRVTPNSAIVVDEMRCPHGCGNRPHKGRCIPQPNVDVMIEAASYALDALANELDADLLTGTNRKMAMEKFARFTELLKRLRAPGQETEP
jgi:hypothetical protein